ncbi:MAG: recombinase family protein [Hyphomicrobium sp.]
MAKTLFYARVSTRDQKADLQIEAAKRLGVKTANIYVEKASGTRHDRPVLAKALAALNRGDTLACYKLDRLGRSMFHLAKVVEELDARGISFMTTEDGLSTKGSTGKLVLHMLGAVAQFERDLILERTRAGLAAARKRGKRLGPPLKWQADMAKRGRNLMKKDGLNADEAARVLGVSRRTLFRGLKAARDHDALAAAHRQI